MDNLNYILTALMVVTAFFAVVMLFSKQAISCAMGLLGVLLGTAGIYGLIGEHFIATIQLVVYAGAIMILFIFSIMLLNIKHDSFDLRWKKPIFGIGIFTGLAVFYMLYLQINQFFAQNSSQLPKGPFTREAVAGMGGNSEVLAHALFTQHFVSFEAISLALLVALVGAVVLAKRKFD